MTADPRSGPAAYVCVDPGVPVFGTKGASIHVRAVLGELARRTAEVHLVTVRPGGDPPPELAGVTVHELARPGGDAAARESALVDLDDAVAERLEAIVGERSPAVVYQRYSLWSCAPMELAARRGWPSVLEINAPLVDEQARHRDLVDRATAETMTRRAVRAAARPIAVTPAVAGWAERLAGRPVAVVPNGVDPSRFAPRRHRGGRRPGPVTIGFVGTFKPWHDLDTLVETASRLRRTPGVPAARIVLIGDGPEHPRIVARLTAVVGGGAVDAVGAVPADRVPALLAGLDIAVAPYGREEQYFSPLKVFEYLAAGVAVVASAVDGLAGVVRGHEAVLVPPGDTDAFAAAVIGLCRDRAARAALGRAGRRAAVERFGWDRTVERTLAGLPGGDTP